jgi:hypothetical protein
MFVVEFNFIAFALLPQALKFMESDRHTISIPDVILTSYSNQNVEKTDKRKGSEPISEGNEIHVTDLHW